MRGTSLVAADGGEAARETAGAAVFSIGELAREFKVTPRTLRFYEDRGLLSTRRVGLSRLYSRRDRARLKLVLMGKRVGFSLAEIGEMLSLYELHDAKVPQLRAALAKFEAQIAYLRRQKGDIEQALAELDRTVAVVGGMLRERENLGAG
jgi:DNA-binding transcriptional MerR regulator